MTRLNHFRLTYLRDELAPYRLHWFPRLRSTNDHAAHLRQQGKLPLPAIVLTGNQTAGRGRGAHRWWSRRGCITVTFALPLTDHIQPHQLPLLAGVAVWRAATEITGSARLRLKWPNDLLADGRKIAGLLCERVHKANLIGLGLNVNRAEDSSDVPLPPAIGWLSATGDRAYDVSETLLTVARQLQQMLREHARRPFAELLREYDSHHALIGQKITVVPGAMDDGHPVETPITGTCLGLDEMGRLLLRNRSGLQRIITGQVLR